MRYHVPRADNADEHARLEVEQLLGRADDVFEQRASVKAEAKLAAEEGTKSAEGENTADKGGKGSGTNDITDKTTNNYQINWYIDLT